MVRGATAMLWVVAIGTGHAQAQAPLPSQAVQARAQTASTATQASRKKSPYQPESLTRGAKNFYSATLGVDELKVRRTNSGNLIRFSYRITDPERAKALADRQLKPYLLGHRSHAMLQVPVMDKVGPLRQAPRLEAGKEYWMVFSNKGDIVKAGERVSVVLGTFRVDGLRVE
jgi:hypothetical protein